MTQGRGGRGARPIGVLVIVVAVVLAIAISRGARQPVAGTPVPPVFPSPPAVGSCLLSTGQNAPTTVSCVVAHTAELTAAYPVGTTVPTDQQGDCATAAAAYIGPLPDDPSTTALEGWTVQPIADQVAMVTAPISQQLAGLGWSGCIVEPATGGSYTGTIRNLSSDLKRPAVYSSCFDTDLSDPVSCTTPHKWEALGTQQVSVQDARTAVVIDDPAVQQSYNGCLTLAAALTGNVDPSYQSALLVQISVVDATPSAATGSVVAQSVPAGGTAVTVQCRIGASSGELSTSIVGWGNRNPPPR